MGALVVWGGPKIFAAGADIKAMAEWGPDEVKPSVDALGEACDLLEATPKISIAAVNRYALGGGMELALAADLRLLGDDARLGQPEIGIGVIPGRRWHAAAHPADRARRGRWNSCHSGARSRPPRPSRWG